MRVALATVSEYANLAEGVINIIGMRQTWAFASLPARVPITISFWLTVDPEDYGHSFELGLECLAPSGAKLFSFDNGSVLATPPEEPEGISGINIILNAGGLEVTEAGRYQVRLYVDKALAHSFEFAVVIKDVKR